MATMATTGMAAVLVMALGVPAEAAPFWRFWDRVEDRVDRREDVRDRREDRRDAAHQGGLRDRIEDVFDRREDRRDRREDRRDCKRGSC